MVSQKIILLLLIFVSQLLLAEDLFQAKIFSKGSEKEELLFTHFNEREVVEDSLYLKHYYAKPDGNLAALDLAILSDNRFVRGSSTFYEVDEKGEVDLSSGTLKMAFTDKDTRKEKEIDFEGNLLLGPLFNNYITDNWKQILEGEKVYFYLPAPNLLRVAKFYVVEDDSNPYVAENRTVVRMTVNSFFLKFLIDSTYFVYESDSLRLKEIHGTTILRTKKDGKWRDTTEVEIYYEY